MTPHTALPPGYELDPAAPPPPPTWWTDLYGPTGQGDPISPATGEHQ